jgi:hypothetical protein
VHGIKVNAYSLAFNERKKDNLGVGLFERLKLGGPVSFYSLKESNSFTGFSSNASSLSWMGTTASDVINSRYFLSMLLIAVLEVLREAFIMWNFVVHEHIV